MSEETMAEFTARLAAQVTPEELAAIAAQSDAMVQRAEIYERAITERLKAILALRDTEHGLAMQAHLAAVLALEELRVEILGAAQPTFEETSRRYRLLLRETVDSLKFSFRAQEASN